MSESIRSPSKVTKKSSRACERCRSMKVRCSGDDPCARCQKSGKSCHFALLDKRVNISESYLRELEGRSRSSTTPTQTPAGPSGHGHARHTSGSSAAQPGSISNDDNQHTPVDPRIDDVGVTDDPAAHAFHKNPLADKEYTFLPLGGRLFYMGPTSSWSFCRRVLAMLGQRVPEQSYAPDPGHLDGSACRLVWTALPTDQIPDVTNLPPIDYALFLFTTSKFFLGIFAYSIEPEPFIARIRDFYNNPVEIATHSRHWYAQFLLFLAFGKAFVASWNGAKEPPGASYAIRALALMPDLAGLQPNSIDAVRALTMGAVYLHCVDMRIGALQHIRHAVLICVVEGWHRHMPDEVASAEYARHCTITFWHAYHLDRYMGPLMGAPSSIADAEITTQLPSRRDPSLNGLCMTIHVQLARLMARIVSAIYGVDDTGPNAHASLLTCTQDVLRDLAGLSRDMSSFLDTHFSGTVDKASRLASQLTLSFHHCVVLSTRPLVMCLLRAQILSSPGSPTAAASNLPTPASTSSSAVPTAPLPTLHLPPTLTPLLSTLLSSALATLRTLRTLSHSDLLAPLLPFQVEDVFSSAFILYLLRMVKPGFVPSDEWIADSEMVLDSMIKKGSVVASLRRRELRRLRESVNVVERVRLGETARDEGTAAGAPGTAGSGAQGNETGVVETDARMPDVQHGHEDHIMHTMSLDDPSWDLFASNGMINMSADEMVELAALLDANPLGAEG